MRSLSLWILACVVTIASAIYQKRTGPSWPVSGKLNLAGSEIRFKLLRSHDVGDQPVALQAADSNLTAVLHFHRYKTGDSWTEKEMLRHQDSLISSLPHQPPAGKLEYYLTIGKNEQVWRVPPQGYIITRFKGHVPVGVLIPHIIFIFAAMLLSTRTALAVWAGSEKLLSYTRWTVGLLLLGGMILGPFVQKYAFNAFWTGVPYGYDLTDNKTLIAFLAWLMALWAVHKREHHKRWIVAAALITLIIFIIPHSMFGSELDYSKTTIGP
jgi:hypothetical protein